MAMCATWPAVTTPTLLELYGAWPAVTLPTLLWRLVHPPTNRKAQHACTGRGRCIACERVSAYMHPACKKCLKTMNAKNTKKSLLHEHADTNITCDFGDGDISRYRSRFPHTHTHTHTHTHGQAGSHIASSIIVRLYTFNCLICI